MLANIVLLATLVKSSDAFTDQFATNQKKQNIQANTAVSRVVSGGSPRMLPGREA